MIQDPTTRTPEELGARIDLQLRCAAGVIVESYADDGHTLGPAAHFVPNRTIELVEYLLAELRAVRRPSSKPTGEPRFWTDDRDRKHPLCAGLTKRGTECKADARPDSTLCLTHDPATTRRRRSSVGPDPS
jgi:hypothetical protein